MNNILEATLQIKDKNMIWDNKVQEKVFKKRKSLFYSATYTHKPEFCTVCGCVSQNNNIVKNGTKTSRITLCSVSGLPAYLNLRKQRFLCRECGSSFTADTSRIVEKHCHISKRLKNEIKSKISETVSETYIAKETNVSVHTVRRIIDDTARLLTIKPLHDLPEHLCFDEFKSVKSSDSNMSFIICDSTTHKLVDVVRDRKSYSLKQYFYRFEPKTRLKETIEAATQLDLSPGLKRVLKTLMTYLPYIQNTCEYPTRTNGPIEGINNKIKVLKRNAYGFKNYYHFRNRIILITKMFGPKQKGIKQQLVA